MKGYITSHVTCPIYKIRNKSIAISEERGKWVGSRVNGASVSLTLLKNEPNDLFFSFSNALFCQCKKEYFKVTFLTRISFMLNQMLQNLTDNNLASRGQKKMYIILKHIGCTPY